MNRQTLFFILFSYLLLALAVTVDAHNSHHSRHSRHSHKARKTITETSTNTVTIVTTSSICEATPTPTPVKSVYYRLPHHHDKRHHGHNYDHSHRGHKNDHSHRYKVTVTVTPTTTLCATPSPVCIPGKCTLNNFVECCPELPGGIKICNFPTFDFNDGICGV